MKRFVWSENLFHNNSNYLELFPNSGKDNVNENFGGKLFGEQLLFSQAAVVQQMGGQGGGQPVILLLLILVQLILRFPLTDIIFSSLCVPMCVLMRVPLCVPLYVPVSVFFFFFLYSIFAYGLGHGEALDPERVLNARCLGVSNYDKYKSR